MKRVVQLIIPCLLGWSQIVFSQQGTAYHPIWKDSLEVAVVHDSYLASKQAAESTAGEQDCNCDEKKQNPQLAYQKTYPGQVVKDTLKNTKNSKSTSGIFRTAETTPRYLDPSVPIEARITDLLPRLTLEEKVLQLSDSWGSKGIPRLKVPAMLKTEGLHGQSYSTGATIFPQPIAMATTFDTRLINKVGQATAVEAKAANLRCSWSPVLDVARDARWGRVEETYGEDPYLVSRLGVAWINGFQGENMIAVPKHFAGHGEPLGGRDSHDVGLSDRTMRNIHLVPFRAAVKEAHVGGVMAAYSTWNGVPDNASTELLQKILREEWGFTGFVVSDCSGPENFVSKQSIVNNLEDACRLAILAGVDIECGSAYTKALVSTVQKGLLRESNLDPNLRRVLRAKFKLGLFENPGSPNMVWDKLSAYDTPEHRALAREVAVEGSVLLRNENKLLPLSKNIKTIAVLGPNADVAQTGDYSAKYSPNQLITVLQAVKSHVDPGTQVLYAKGCSILSSDTSGFAEAVRIAKQSDAVILIVGDQSNRAEGKSTTGENKDGATLEIPGVQRQLIKAVQAAGKPVVLVLVNGKPFTLAWEAENIPAILETWYPGEEGGNATADLIFGDRNPSGRLPITLPRHVGQEPLWYDYMPSGRNYNYYDMPFSPLYRFGHGLSYTSFNYSNLRTESKKEDPGFVTVSADIENTGDRDGDEVAQLYVTDMLTSVITPVIELKGVDRVTIKKGEKKTVIFELTPYQLSLLNAGMERVLEPGRFRVHIGGVSPAPPEGNAEHKQKIGFSDPAQGISGDFEVSRQYKADFKYNVKSPAIVKGGESFLVTVTVKNQGNLVDIAEIKLYGETLLDTYRSEIEPGETQTHVFNVTLYKGGIQNITAIVGQKVVTQAINVSKALAKLELVNIRTTIGQDGILHYAATAANAGSNPYKGNTEIKVDGKSVVNQDVELAPGEHRELALTYAFPRSGAFGVKIGDAAEQQMIVPGSIGLALQDPLLYLSFDDTKSSSVKNEVNGKELPVQGTVQYVNGKEGKAFKTNDSKTYISAGGIDLYRKPFTLAAWINIEAFDKGQAAFFGGQAPMGADVDITGTILSAGVSGENLLFSFQNREVKGGSKIPVGKWTHVAYTYNPVQEQGSVYINGKLDKVMAQKPYAGPLEMIGGSPRSNHGQYALDEVLVTRSCLQPTAIRELAAKGIEGLYNGKLITDWRPVTSSLVTLHTWATIPANSHIKVIIESGDKSGGMIDSKSVELKNGENSISLENFRVGTQIRIRLELTAAKWSALPVLQTVILSGKDDLIRWSTTEEWQKGNASGGLKIGL